MSREIDTSRVFLSKEGRSCRTLHFAPRHAREPQGVPDCMIFPLPLIALADNAPRPASSRERARLRRRWHLTRDANSLISALNSLFYGPTQESELVPRPPPSPAQVAILRHLIDLSKSFFEIVGAWRDEDKPVLEPPVFFYGQPALLESGSFVFDADDPDPPSPAPIKGNFILHTSHRAALPAPGTGAQVVALDHLPPKLRALYECPSGILRIPSPSPTELKSVKSINGVASGQYVPLVSRMVEAGIAEFHDSPPVVVNDLFGVVKDEWADRVIFAGQRCNLFFNPPPNPELPTPSDFQNLLLPSDKKVFIGKTDVSNMFFLLLAPVWLRPYFGLQPICLHSSEAEHDNSCLWPRFKVLPMGWSHSVTIAQAVMLSTVSASAMGRALSFSGPSLIVLGSARFTYVDDAGSFSASSSLAQDMHISALATMVERGLTPNLSKSRDPMSEEPATLLGFQVSNQGEVRPVADKLRLLLRVTQEMISTRTATPSRFRSLVGSWIWILLLNRPLLSVLRAECFRFASSASRAALPIPDEVLEDLIVLIDIAPLLRLSLKSQRCHTLLCSDACLSGGAVVSVTVPSLEWDRVYECRVTKGWYSRLSAFEGDETPSLHFDDRLLPLMLGKWQTNVVKTWERSDIIDALEGHALVLGLRWLLNDPMKQGKRVILFTDSSALLGALVKGRSSCLRLNNVCRRVAALAGASGSCFYFLWVPSELNPADEPSRRSERR